MTAAVGADRRGVGSVGEAAIAFAERALDRFRPDGSGGSADGTADAVALLDERHPEASMTGLGPVSMGGSARLLRAADAWVAVNLPRSDDLDLLPAWLGVDASGEVPWNAIAAAVAGCRASALVGAAQELGLAVGLVPADDAEPDEQLLARGTTDARVPFLRTPVGTSVGARSLDGLHVVDLSALWAGPVCARLLREAGARVTKVESTTRPDGARSGDPSFFAALHAGKEFRTIPFDSAAGLAELRDLLASADVVIEASRPRALERLGIDPHQVIAQRPGAVWVSITAHGRTGPWRDRVGFGDDVAAAAGLVERDAQGRPGFLGDAIADPLAGITAAALVHDALARGGGAHLDVAMREVARSAALGAEVQW